MIRLKALTGNYRSEHLFVLKQELTFQLLTNRTSIRKNCPKRNSMNALIISNYLYLILLNAP